MRAATGLLAAVVLSTAAVAGDSAPLAWTGHMGDLAFVVGIDAGREEVKFTGKPAMLFFTSATDAACPVFAARTWKDKVSLENVAGYTPVLVDFDFAPPTLLATLKVEFVPSVLWLDFDEKTLYGCNGDAPLDEFRKLTVTAKARCPAARPPTAGFTALMDWKKKLDDGATAKDVKAQLAAIAAIRKIGRGEAVQRATVAADARLTKEGEAELERVNGLITAKKKPEAKKALEKLVADYGADHAVGKKAQEALDLLTGKTKPKK